MFKQLVFPLYARMASRPHRRADRHRRRSTDRGRLLQTATLITLALGIDTDLNLIYQLFALLVCLIIVGRISLRFNRPAVSVQRRLPGYATVGEPFTWYIDVRNEGNRLEQDLRITDNPCRIAPTREEFVHAREPFEHTRNLWDRFIGYHRFVWLMRLRTGIVAEPRDLPDLGLSSRLAVPMEATPLRRGQVAFESTDVLYPDAMGLSYGICRFYNPARLTVLPKRYAVSRHFILPGGRHFQRGGVGANWASGESDEFVSLRDYREGDPVRKIHWPSTARRAKPVVREFQEEYRVRQALMLETETDDKLVLEEAISLAASLILHERGTESMLDLIYHADTVELISAVQGPGSVNRQLEALAAAGPSRDSLTALAAAAARHGNELSGCIIILTRWDEEREAAVDTVRASGVTLKILVVTSDPENTRAPSGVRVLDAANMESEVAAL